MQVPLLDFTQQYVGLKDEIVKEISDICDSQRFVLGEKVQKLEQEIAEYCGANYACGVTSGSDALIIALMVENIGAGDEVITTPFTFFATAGAISRVGATPVFVDIEPDTFNIDPVKIEEKITPRTKAIIPVHLFGQCCDMDAINAIAARHNLIVIEDACQSIGAEYKGKRAGSIGDYGCFSFYPTKNLGCFGDGGMVTCNDEKKAELLNIYRNHGQGSTYIHHYVGGNFRLDALQAAVLSIKLKELDGWSEARARNAAEYNEIFAASKLGDKIQAPVVANFATRHIYNQYSILVKGGSRDELRSELMKKSIGSGVYYPLSLHQQECFKSLGYKEGDMPVSEQASKEILSLPIFPESTTEQRKFVVKSIENILCD